MIDLWRLTMECGHLKLYGPWGGNPPAIPAIGDVSFCEVCPKVDKRPYPELRMRQVVDVEAVPMDRYREPVRESAMVRQRQQQ